MIIFQKMGKKSTTSQHIEMINVCGVDELIALIWLLHIA
jgi:hypothetical protein